MTTTHLTPAEVVIRAFGGVNKTARAIGRNGGAVCRWRKPKEERGTNGRIPSEAQGLILQAARRLKIKITAEDLIHGRRG